MNITLFSFVLVCILFILVIESVRRGILETKYSIIWIVMCVILAILSLSDGLLQFVAGVLGVFYAPSILFLFGLICTLAMIFDLTRRISNINAKLVTLTQEYTLFKEKFEKHIHDQQLKKGDL
jgi:hypothetical protein